MTRTEYVPYEKTVTVTENRAPTDDSIRLWDEMRQKALDSIVKELTVEVSMVKATVIVLMAPTSLAESPFELTFLGRFNLNGKDFRFEGKLDTRTIRHEVDVWGQRKDRETILAVFTKALSEAIAAYMIAENKEFIQNLVR